MRRGISLLEVLFAMFILAVGLLGLAAMVPVGSHQITEATHADRGTAIGQAAFSEVKVRDMLDPESWVGYDFTANAWTAFEPDPETVGSFVIDPLGVARNIAGTKQPEYGVFPYGGTNFVTPANPVFPKPLRVTVQDLGLFEASGGATLQPYGVAMADRQFRVSDDLQFELPSDKTRRPVLVDQMGNRQTQSAGDYSWMVMFTPQRTTDELNTFKVSVVVFYKRDLVVDTSDINVPASERIVYCDLVNSGLGGSNGGDVQLRIVDSAGFTPTARQAERIVKVRPNQWVMVSSQHAGTGDTTHSWYRVVSTSEMQSTASPWVADVTLSGPDLQATRTDAGVTTVLLRDIDGDSANGYTCHATICDGVVGVFEKVVKLDEPSPWSAH